MQLYLALFLNNPLLNCETKGEPVHTFTETLEKKNEDKRFCYLPEAPSVVGPREDQTGETRPGKGSREEKAICKKEGRKEVMKRREERRKEWRKERRKNGIEKERKGGRKEGSCALKAKQNKSSSSSGLVITEKIHILPHHHGRRERGPDPYNGIASCCRIADCSQRRSNVASRGDEDDTVIVDRVTNHVTDSTRIGPLSILAAAGGGGHTVVCVNNYS